MDTFEAMEKIKRQADSSKYELHIQCIKSHAVPFQRYFLRKEDLSLKANQK